TYPVWRAVESIELQQNICPIDYRAIHHVYIRRAHDNITLASTPTNTSKGNIGAFATDAFDLSTIHIDGSINGEEKSATAGSTVSTIVPVIGITTTTTASPR